MLFHPKRICRFGNALSYKADPCAGIVNLAILQSQFGLIMVLSLTLVIIFITRYTKQSILR